MKLLGALILVLILSTACGLKCYVCALSDPHSCTNALTCPAGMDRCFSLTTSGTVTKSCIYSVSCVSPMSCCEGNLCNSAIPTGPSAMLLLVSSAIITIFL
ncbi:ly-6/neurotoxin-like protein 1 isoform X1 [Simochromis diagramma]|uniref:ly-6/neurotoxin-like protein 1 isoform X1 n=1 Tax=Simochromis diagramma TaxID=43689 RepID=UPI001A7EBA56|nr:ly-6/neurotoxin-like protein 1 isoform X1 [Simochromis diagramma]